MVLCERNCLALQDFSGEQGPVTALDLGCAVGGSSFALARAFQQVVGVDSSAHFIKSAQVSIYLFASGQHVATSTHFLNHL